MTTQEIWQIEDNVRILSNQLRIFTVAEISATDRNSAGTLHMNLLDLQRQVIQTIAQLEQRFSFN